MLDQMLGQRNKIQRRFNTRLKHLFEALPAR